jgi:hypothetical protein
MVNKKQIRAELENCLLEQFFREFVNNELDIIGLVVLGLSTLYKKDLDMVEEQWR